MIKASVTGSIDNTFGNNLQFDSGLNYDDSSLHSFSNFYKTLLQPLKNAFSHIPYQSVPKV